MLALTLAIFIYMKYSKQGYEIAVVGESENTARYAGINVKKVIIRTMALSGAICGIAGFIIVSGASHTISTSTAGGRDSRPSLYPGSASSMHLPWSWCRFSWYSCKREPGRLPPSLT